MAHLVQIPVDGPPHLDPLTSFGARLRLILGGDLCSVPLQAGVNLWYRSDASYRACALNVAARTLALRYGHTRLPIYGDAFLAEATAEGDPRAIPDAEDAEWWLDVTLQPPQGAPGDAYRLREPAPATAP